MGQVLQDVQDSVDSEKLDHIFNNLEKASKRLGVAYEPCVKCLNSSHIGLFLMNQAGVIHWSNSQLEHLVGRGLRGANFTQLFLLPVERAVSLYQDLKDKQVIRVVPLKVKGNLPLKCLFKGTPQEASADISGVLVPLENDNADREGPT